jgi:hypothetical protein
MIHCNGYNAFEIYQDRLLSTQRFVPPEKVSEPVETSQCERDQLKLCNSQPLSTSCDTLNDEPGRVEDGNGFGEKVTLRSVVYLGGGNVGQGDSGFAEKISKAIEGKSSMTFGQI